MPQGPDDLFELKINTSGKYYIRKFLLLARITILLGIVVSCINVTSSLIYYFVFQETSYGNYEYMILRHKLLPYYAAFYCLLFYPQMYFYWKVTGLLKKGVDYNDEDTFNKAFRAFFQCAVFGVASLLLSLLSYGFELFVILKYYVK